MNLENGQQQSINDSWIFAFVYPCISLLIIHIGNDNTFFELVAIPSYYSDLLLSLVCVYAFGLYIRNLSSKANLRFPLETALMVRVRYHVLFGIFAPTIVLVFVEMMYVNQLLGIPIGESSIFYLELPLILIFSSVINLLYGFLYFRLHGQNLIGLLDDLRTQPPRVFSQPPGSTKHHFVVTQGARSIKVEEKDIAYFKVVEKSTFLVTVNGKEYLQETSLENISKLLSPEKFFLLNRQVLASRESIDGYDSTSTRKLLIRLSPAMDEIYVSKVKASTFIKWFKGS